MFWWYVLPLGFLLTQYTITGFDASAHISEETHGAAESAPKGVWQSVFYSAIIGYIVLLAITFAAQATPTALTDGAGTVDRRVRERDDQRLGQAHPDHLRGRPVLLRHELHDERLAHDVRVQP